MRKYIIFLIILIFSTVTLAQTWPITNQNVGSADRLRRLLQNRFDKIDEDIAGGSFYNIGTGNIRYVDSGRANATTIDGLTKERAEPTLEAVFAQATNGLTANNGDVVYVLQNHEENFSTADAADMDVAGVTVICLGDGEDAPTFTYTAAAGELVVGAANITFYGGRLVPATDDVLMAVSVEAGGDNFTMIGTEFPEPSTVTWEFLDAIDLASGADGLRLYNVIYRHMSTTGPAHFLEAGNGVNKDVRIEYCDIAGEFSVSAIWSDTIDSWWTIAHNYIANLTAGQHAIEFTAAAEGWILDNRIYCSATPTSIDPGSMHCIENYVQTTIDRSGSLYPAQ